MVVGVVYEWGIHTEGLPVTLDELSGVPIVTIDGGYDTGVVIDDRQLHFVRGAMPPQPPANNSVDTSSVCSMATSMNGMVMASFGSEHSLVLEKSGKVYSWGNGMQGQLGLGATVLSTSEPTELWNLRGKRAVAVASGREHAAAVTADGGLYTWGRGHEGQTGHASPSMPAAVTAGVVGVALLPKCVGALARHKVVGVACGDRFTAVVTAAGAVWTCGEGRAGQLGLGQKCAQRGTPAPAFAGCERHGAGEGGGGGAAAVACGWGHTLAVCGCGCLYAWGLNTYGQLGLGDTRARFAPERVTYPPDPDDEMSVRRPFKVRAARAAGNLSAATGWAAGELFTWGFGQDGRLGHGLGPLLRWRRAAAAAEEARSRNSADEAASLMERSRTSLQVPEETPPQPMLHELRPRAVRALEGKRVNAFAAYKGGFLAFVASACYTITPALGPVSGGTNLTITGGGFWDSPDIVVRFAPAPPPRPPRAAAAAAEGEGEGDEEDEEEDGGGGGGGRAPAAVARSAIGKYQGIDPDSKQQVIMCRAPKFATTGDVIVEVAVNGIDFTETQRVFKYYDVPEIHGMAPHAADMRHEVKVRVDGNKLMETGMVKLKFKLKNEQETEYIVDAQVVTESLGVEYDSDEEEEIERFETYVSAIAPVIKDATPAEARVSLALNGASFAAVPRADFVFHRATLHTLAPASVPLGGGAAVEVRGADFFSRGGGLQARLRLPRPPSSGGGGGGGDGGGGDDREDKEEEEGEGEADPYAPIMVPLELADPTRAKFELPPLTHLSSDIVDLHVDVTIDSFKNILGTQTLKVYKNPTFSIIGLDCCPANSTTGITLKAETPIFQTNDCKVRVRVPGGLLDAEVPAEILRRPPTGVDGERGPAAAAAGEEAGEAEAGGGGEGEADIMQLEKDEGSRVSTSSNARGSERGGSRASAAAATGKAGGGVGGGPAFLHFKLPAFDWGAEDAAAAVAGWKAEEEEARAAAAAAAAAASSRPGTSGSRPRTAATMPEFTESVMTAEITVALNGRDPAHSPARLRYYRPPRLAAAEPEQGSAAAGGELALRGEGLFASDHVLVRLTSAPGKKGDCAGVLELPGTFSGGRLVLAVPPLPKEDFASPLAIDVAMDGRTWAGLAFEWPFGK